MKLRKKHLFGIWGRDAIIAFGEKTGTRQIISLTDRNFNFYRLDHKKPHNNRGYGYIVVDQTDIKYRRVSHFEILKQRKLINKPLNVFYVHRRRTNRRWWRCNEWVLEQQFIDRQDPNEPSFITWLKSI